MRRSNRLLLLDRTATARGAGMTEYVVVLALVAIAVLASVKLFGWRVEERYFGGAIEVESLGDQGSPSGGSPMPRGARPQ